MIVYEFDFHLNPKSMPLSNIRIGPTLRGAFFPIITPIT
jgi:hypothetical protein